MKTPPSTAFAQLIHAPAGATSPIAETQLSNRFQSTLPCGERHKTDGLSRQICQVSIHAPVRGATAFVTGQCQARTS